MAYDLTGSVINSTPDIYNLNKLLTSNYRDNPIWNDLASAVTTVLINNVQSPRRELQRLRLPYSSSPNHIAAALEKIYLIKAAKMLGFSFYSDLLAQDDYIRLCESLSLYWPTGGTNDFASFLGYINDVSLETVQLWSMNNVPNDPIYEGLFSHPKGPTVLTNVNNQWYPTSHVNLLYNVESAPINLSISQLSSLFYVLAPIQLVLNQIIPTAYGDTTLYFGASGVQTIRNIGAYNAISLFVTVTAFLSNTNGQITWMIPNTAQYLVGVYLNGLDITDTCSLNTSTGVVTYNNSLPIIAGDEVEIDWETSNYVSFNTFTVSGNGQTIFTISNTALQLISVTINGIDTTENCSLNTSTGVITYNSITGGYPTVIGDVINVLWESTLNIHTSDFTVSVIGANSWIIPATSTTVISLFINGLESQAFNFTQSLFGNTITYTSNAYTTQPGDKIHIVYE